MKKTELCGLQHNVTERCPTNGNRAGPRDRWWVPTWGQRPGETVREWCDRLDGYSNPPARLDYCNETAEGVSEPVDWRAIAAQLAWAQAGEPHSETERAALALYDAAVFAEQHFVGNPPARLDYSETEEG